MNTLQVRKPGQYVHFALPLARGDYHWERGTCPVDVYDGATSLPVQVERVARYSDGSASVIYVLADAGRGHAPASVTWNWVGHDRETGEFKWHPKLAELRGQFATRPTPIWHGPVAIQRRLQGSTPIWATFFSGSPCVRVDALMHNGLAGAGDTLVDVAAVLEPLGVPAGWSVSYVVAEPVTTGQAPWLQRQFRIVRFVLHPEGVPQEAIDNAMPATGWTVARQEWLTHEAFGPTLLPAADLGHIHGNLDTKHSWDYANLKAAILTGNKYPKDATFGRLGMFHPYGYAYGGTTSGTEIWQYQADLIETASPDGLMGLFYEQRMDVDRDRVAAIAGTGEPITYEDMLDTNGNPISNWRMSADSPGRFDRQGSTTLDGPFGWSTRMPIPDSAHPDIVSLRQLQAIDFAHRIRRLRQDVGLIWLANDSLSRFLLRHEAELARMSALCGRRLYNTLSAAMAHPGRGCHWDRIQGWQAFAIAAGYQLGTNAERSRYTASMMDMRAVARYSATTSGIVSVLASGKQIEPAPYNKAMAVCVAIQHGLVANGIAALDRTLGQPAAWPYHLGVEWLRDGTQTCWSGAVYQLPNGALIQPRNTSFDSHLWATGSHDSEQTRASLGHALLAGQDAMPVVHAMLGADPIGKLKSMGMGIVDSDAVLLAALQRLA